MPRSIRSFVALVLALALADCNDGITDLRPSAPTLSIVSGGGDNQTAPAGTTLPLPLIVQVTGVSGSANGQILNFVATSGGGSVFANVVLTGTPKSGPYSKLSGIAENTWTLGPIEGPQTLEARLVDPLTGATLTQATFHASAGVAGPALLKAVSGDKQTAVAGTLLHDSVKVVVADKLGNPQAGVNVVFRIAAGGGSSSSSVVSGQGGTAATPWIVGRTAGRDTLIAFLGSDPASPGASTVTFSATGIPGAASQIVSVLGDGQHAALGSTLPIAPTVQIRDANGNGVAGVAVTLTVTAGGGTMSGIKSVTTLSDSSGKVSVGWTIGSLPGANTLRATALGLTGSPVIFGATSYTPLYVANQNAHSITVYEAEATGNVTPIRTIAGPNTLLSTPANLVLDSQGQLYVTNYTGNSITVYAAGAAGNVAPIRTITGASTGFTRPYALARDASGQLYVFDYASHSIEVFAANADGNATPLRVIGGDNTRLAGAPSLAVAPTGEIYAADQDALRIRVFAAGANGDVAPIREISGAAGFQPTGLVLDATGQMYVTNFRGNNVEVFSAGADGNAAPVRTIVGPSTNLSFPVGIWLDASGTIYVANNIGQSVNVFAAGASGDVAPVREIVGANTGLDYPGWLTF